MSDLATLLQQHLDFGDPHLIHTEAYIDALEAEVERLRATLRTIAAYGNGRDGICPYGCDTPWIARAALTAAALEEA